MERNHLKGQGLSNVVSAAVLDNIYLQGLDTETLSPSASFPRRKQQRLEPPLQTSGQLFTRGTDSNRVDGNFSPTDTGVTVLPRSVRHAGPAWPDIEDKEDGSESGEVPRVVMIFTFYAFIFTSFSSKSQAPTLSFNHDVRATLARA